MKSRKEQGIEHCIDLDVLREQGFMVELRQKENSPWETSYIVLTAKDTRKGTVIKDEVAAELELTYGVKKTDKIQKRAVQMLNNLAFADALRRATK